MKIKLSFFAAFIAVTALSFASCSNGDDPTPGPEPKPVTIKVTSDDFTNTTFEVAVTPDNNSVLYYTAFFTQKEFDTYGTDGSIQDYVDLLLKQLQAGNPDKSLGEIIALISNEGSTVRSYTYMNAGEVYYPFAVALNTEGTVISSLFYVKVTLPEATGNNPVLDPFELKAGDINGADKTTKLTLFAAMTDAAQVLYGRYVFATTEAVIQMRAAGLTYEDMLDMRGEEFTAQMLTGLNTPAGIALTVAASPNQEITCLAQVVTAGGKMATFRADGRPDEQ